MTDGSEHTNPMKSRDEETEHTDPSLWDDPTGERREKAVIRTARTSRFSIEELSTLPLWALSEEFIEDLNPVENPQAVMENNPIEIQNKASACPSSTTSVNLPLTVTHFVHPRPLTSSRIPGPPSTTRIPEPSCPSVEHRDPNIIPDTAANEVQVQELQSMDKLEAPSSDAGIEGVRLSYVQVYESSSSDTDEAGNESMPATIPDTLCGRQESSVQPGSSEQLPECSTVTLANPGSSSPSVHELVSEPSSAVLSDQSSGSTLEAQYSVTGQSLLFQLPEPPAWLETVVNCLRSEESPEVQAEKSRISITTEMLPRDRSTQLEPSITSSGLEAVEEEMLVQTTRSVPIDTEDVTSVDEAELEPVETLLPESCPEDQPGYDPEEDVHVYGVEEYYDDSPIASFTAINIPAPDASTESLSGATKSEREIIIASRVLKGLKEPRPVEDRPTFRTHTQKTCDSMHNHVRTLPLTSTVEVARGSSSEPVSMAACHEAKAKAASTESRPFPGSPHGSEISICSSPSMSEESVNSNYIWDSDSDFASTNPIDDRVTKISKEQPIPRNFDSSNQEVCVSPSQEVRPNLDTCTLSKEFNSPPNIPIDAEHYSSSEEDSDRQAQGPFNSDKTSNLPIVAAVPSPIANTPVADTSSEKSWTTGQVSRRHSSTINRTNVAAERSAILGTYRQPKRRRNPGAPSDDDSDRYPSKRPFKKRSSQENNKSPTSPVEPSEVYLDAESYGDDLPENIKRNAIMSEGITNMVYFPFRPGKDNEQTLVHVDIPYEIECYYEDNSFYARIMLTSLIDRLITYKIVPSNDKLWEIQGGGMGIILPGQTKQIYAYTTVVDYPLAYTDLVHDTFLLRSAPFFYNSIPGEEPNEKQDVARFWSQHPSHLVPVVEEIHLSSNIPFKSQWLKQTPKIPEYIRSFKSIWWMPAWITPKNTEPLDMQQLTKVKCSSAKNAFQQNVDRSKIINAHLNSLENHASHCSRNWMMAMFVIFLCISVLIWPFISGTFSEPKPQKPSWFQWF